MAESAALDTGASGGWERRVVSVGGLEPRYGMLDGTWIVSVLLPLCFGVLNGDVGVGLVMLAIVVTAGVALRSRPQARLAAEVLGRAALAAIAFGFLYGEYFNRSLGPVRLNRIETVEAFVSAAAAVVAAQLVANLVAGVVWSTGNRKREDAWAPAMRFAVFAGAAFVAFAVVSLLSTLINGAFEAVADRLGIDEVPDGVVLAIFYLYGMVWASGAVLLADVVLERFDR